MEIIDQVIQGGIQEKGLPKGFKLSQLAYKDLSDCLANIPEQDRLPFTVAYTRGYSLAVNDFRKENK